jgi:hypothetical protein
MNTTTLTKDERYLLDWLRQDGQYGECHGKTLDSLIAKGLAEVLGPDTEINNAFIAKTTSGDIMYRAIRLTDAGREALAR